MRAGDLSGMKPVIVGNVDPDPRSVSAVAAEFRRLLADGYSLRLQGLAKYKPSGYLTRTRAPRHKVELFGVSYYLSDIRRDDGFRFYVAYIVMPQRRPHQRSIYPRIFYKDSSLIWRSASHLISTENEHWVGKGDVKGVDEAGERVYYSAEETTNLPFEIDSALDQISRRASEVKLDHKALALVLRNAPDNRVDPYQDFSGPRRKAMADPSRSINRNRDVAWFAQADDPSSLQFADGFAPDFAHGLIDRSQSFSKLYGGRIDKYRIASANREIQYLFIVGATQAWIIPPQPLDDLLISYGVRAVDANAAEDLCVPGYEFHYLEDPDDPESLHSQIPKGFVGASSEIDPDRADASPWIERLPVMQQFRRALTSGLGAISN